MSRPEQMEVAVRAWAVPDYLRHIENQSNQFEQWVDLGPSEYVVVFDTETTVDAAQRLRVGGFQVRRDGLLVEQGLFFDPEAVSATEVELMEKHARANGLQLIDCETFVREILFYYGYDLRGLIVGFNLPFDLSRLAIDHVTTRSRDRKMRRGFSFQLLAEPGVPRLLIKRIGSRAAFIKFTEPGDRTAEHRNREKGGNVAPFRGYFVDVATLGNSLLGEKYTLKALAETLDTQHRKAPFDDFDRPISGELLTYLCLDVQVTWECFTKLQAIYETYRLGETPIYRIYSEASIGKAHLKEMGLRPWRQSQPDFPDWVIAALMETYYGGRAECAIRRVPVPGVYVDFLSQYPTVYALMGLWRFQIGQGIAYEEEDPAIFQRLLDEVTVDDVLDPQLWKKLHCIALVRPDGDMLPTRARYRSNPRSNGQEAARVWNVALARRTGGRPQWWTGPDCVASKLHTPTSPKVLKVLRFCALEPQPRLRPIDIVGNPDFRIDPYHDDFVKRMVELRALVKEKRDRTRQVGDHQKARQLDALQLGMKIAANAVAYGISVELNQIEHAKPVWTTVHRPDQTSYRTKTRRPEEPGVWFHPLLATLTAGGGRLLLAAAIELVKQAGGSYAFCDTDSLFITATRDGQPVGY